MNTLPAKRKSKLAIARDHKAERTVRRLRKTPLFQALPSHVLRGYAQLTILSSEVREKLREYGLVDSEGTWSPGIDAFRRLKDSEARYLALMLELAAKESGGGHDSDALERAKVVHEERNQST